MRALVAADVMTPEVLAVGTEMSVPKLATFLLDHEVSGAVVKNSRGHPVGVVSLTDIAAAAEGGGEQDDGESSSFYAAPRASDGTDDETLTNASKQLESILVEDIMTPTLHTVEPNTPVRQVAATLLDEHLHRVLVVDGRELVGIISTSDLLGLLVDSD